MRGGGARDLVVGGIALGLAFGTKWYAVAYAPIVVVAFAVALGRRDGWAAALRGTATVSALVAAAGGFWLLRNWVMAGNPVHPSPVEVGGLELFGAPRDEVRELAGWPISHYLFDVDIWRTYLVDSFARSWGI